MLALGINAVIKVDDQTNQVAKLHLIQPAFHVSRNRCASLLHSSAQECSDLALVVAWMPAS
eukprot:233662-Amphidinium_carterae.1